MRTFVDQGSVAVVAEVRWPGGTWSRAYGVRNLESKDAATPSDQVFVASITKSMTAVSVMKLVEDGLIGLDDPVNGILNSFTTVLKPPGPITVRQLLGHTSGMRSFQEVTEKTAADVPRVVTEDITTQRALELTAQLPWEARDVGYFRYSDSNYMALGQLVEKLRGRPYTAVLREDVIDRLKLKDTSVDQSAAAKPGVIRGYITYRDERLDVTEAPGVLGSPAYGAISTMSDINDFYAALFRGDLVSKDSLQEMTKTEAVPLYGLGLWKWNQGCDDDHRFGGTGGFWTYRTASVASTDGQYQATMTLIPPPMPTPLEDPESDDKFNLWDDQMASALQETLDRLCP
ncbi:serine hydrolase domain-containing protein [Pseudarthrobacter sp. NS4]|uniref:serine hydrolase domain-containing protein n=1 Tax=Pseudarthrobacter sp. NS4 TaxID=2973976 RepID=UPI002162FD05|nr:serine hydrolase domain-containing protein [Pseudarthrobacter sp. NS4]